MMHKLDRHIFFRLMSITFFVLLVLIFIYIVIDFSNNSDSFTDKGATMPEIFGIYYLNYIPEIIRLIMPVAVFVACLYLTGQMTDRLEIIALKAAGVSLYRLLVPYLVFAFVMTLSISYLDGFVIPDSNTERIAFEEEYLTGKSERIDRRKIYRQESEGNIFRINYFNDREQTANRVEVTYFEADSIRKTMNIQKMAWQDSTQTWQLTGVETRTFSAEGFNTTQTDTVDTTLNIIPTDLNRSTSDIYQLTYPEANQYLASIKRSGAGGIEDPQVKFYGRLIYPFSMIVVSIIGFSIAAVRHRAGRGFHIAAGLTISFLYLSLMKVVETLGAQGTIDPLVASISPHLFFLIVGIGLLVNARK